MSQIIYIKLMAEQIDVWAPAAATQVEGGLFRIDTFLDSIDDDDQPQFQVGDVVACEQRALTGGIVLVAMEFRSKHTCPVRSIPIGNETVTVRLVSNDGNARVLCRAEYIAERDAYRLDAWQSPVSDNDTPEFLIGMIVKCERRHALMPDGQQRETFVAVAQAGI